MGTIILGNNHRTGTIDPGGLGDKLWDVRLIDLPDVVMERFVVESEDPLMFSNQLQKLGLRQEVLLFLQVQFLEEEGCILLNQKSYVGAHFDLARLVDVAKRHTARSLLQDWGLCFVPRPHITPLYVVLIYLSL